MKIAEFRISNYKSFNDSEPIKLGPGFNIVAGQNNAGKTALLQALSLTFRNHPHRSLATRPSSAEGYPASESVIDLTFNTSGPEISSLLPQEYQLFMGLPGPHGPETILGRAGVLQGQSEKLQKLWEWFLGLQDLSFRMSLSFGPSNNAAWSPSTSP